MTESSKVIELANTASNRKPADELADIREQIKKLKEREGAIRHQALQGLCGLTGDEFKIVIARVVAERVDTDKLKKELGLKFLRPFLRKVQTEYVRLKKLDAVGEEADDDGET